jgi:streptogramin lyase
MSRSIACRLRVCAIFLLACAIPFPASAVKAAVTVYMSGNSDDVYKYTPPGPVSLVAHLPFGTNPEGLAFDTSGNLFVAGGGDVSKITPGGAVSHLADLPSGAGGYGMAIDPSNNLYVADVSLNEISKITPGGTVSTYGTVSSPRGLTFDGSGNLYVVTGGTVDVIAPGGGVSSTYATLTGHPNIYGLAFDTAGYLYVTDITSTTLLKIPPGGGSFSDFATTLSSGPKGLLFDGGMLYVAQPNEDKISTIMLDGTASTFGTANGPRYLAVQPANVPEPSSMVLLGLGLIGALAFFRRRK